jgi:hypothetical protein
MSLTINTYISRNILYWSSELQKVITKGRQEIKQVKYFFKFISTLL